ncbi:hypothetical protein Bbelb_051980 [Branchiostoma belcheri]|nr:hypothetical protein Bbelb_051980 [Branchiostoma belcheri]
MGSDHRPVLTRIELPRHHPQAIKRQPNTFSYQTRGRSVVNSSRKLAKERRKQCKANNKKPCAWWNNEVEEAWNAKMTASKCYSSAKRDKEQPDVIAQKRLDFNTATANYKAKADQARQRTWDTFCLECDPSDPSIISRFGDLAKQLQMKASSCSSGPQQILDIGGKQLRTDKEKGEAFKARFLTQLQADSVHKVENALAEVNTRIQQSRDDLHEPPVTPTEIKRILQKIRKDTTPGPDGVMYSDLKKFDANSMVKLTHLIDESMRLGKIPNDWRDCNMAILPKPNKDHSVLKGYRIITMSNVWIKICEKVAASRLVKDLEERECFKPEVGGARPRRSTTSNLDATVHRIQQNMQKQMHTAIGLFDLEDAYNKVDIAIVARKMREMGISDIITRWVLTLLQSRTCCMKFGTWRSEAFQVSSGLPQGSPLSSVLFNIYTADIALTLRAPSTIASTYVDDVIVEGTGATQHEALVELQEATNKLEGWTIANHMSIQPEKSAWMLASLGHPNADLKLKYAGSEVKRSP